MADHPTQKSAPRLARPKVRLQVTSTGISGFGRLCDANHRQPHNENLWWRSSQNLSLCKFQIASRFRSRNHLRPSIAGANAALFMAIHSIANGVTAVTALSKRAATARTTTASQLMFCIRESAESLVRNRTEIWLTKQRACLINRQPSKEGESNANRS